MNSMRSRLFTQTSRFVQAARLQGYRRLFASISNDRAVRIIEVGPRDGLQNEKNMIPLETKVEFLRRLAGTGLKFIESGSFVSPKWVPQMANCHELLDAILTDPAFKHSGITFPFLVPNPKGFENMATVLNQKQGAYSADAKPGEVGAPGMEIAIFASASEEFSKRNLNMDIRTSLNQFEHVISDAKAMGMRVRAYISVVLGCPYTGYDVKPEAVAAIARDFLEMGVDEISLGDTTGMGTAGRTAKLLRAVHEAGIRKEDIAMHFHDTYGQALVNAAVALEYGIRKFDSAVGGLGGCPFALGATGNVASENMVYFMESVGMDTGVDLEALAEVGGWINGVLKKKNESAVGKAVLSKQKQ